MDLFNVLLAIVVVLGMVLIWVLIRWLGIPTPRGHRWPFHWMNRYEPRPSGVPVWKQKNINQKPTTRP